MTIQRAKYDSITLAEGLKRDGRGELWTEKMDGVWAIKEAGAFTLIGEQMKGYGNYPGLFFAFDCFEVIDPIYGSEGFYRQPYRKRFEFLKSLTLKTLERLNVRIVQSGIGAEFLEAVLARGGEGVVIADLDAPYGCGLTKCKRMVTYDLIVTEKAFGKSSIHLGSMEGEDFGWCPCRADYDRIRVGDIVEIEAFGRHTSGKLREPRFIRIRSDKSWK